MSQSLSRNARERKNENDGSDEPPNNTKSLFTVAATAATTIGLVGLTIWSNRMIEAVTGSPPSPVKRQIHRSKTAGHGETKFTQETLNMYLKSYEKEMDTATTARNWSSVEKLSKLLKVLQENIGLRKQLDLLQHSGDWSNASNLFATVIEKQGTLEDMLSTHENEKEGADEDRKPPAMACFSTEQQFEPQRTRGCAQGGNSKDFQVQQDTEAVLKPPAMVKNHCVSMDNGTEQKYKPQGTGGCTQIGKSKRCRVQQATKETRAQAGTKAKRSTMSHQEMNKRSSKSKSPLRNHPRPPKAAIEGNISSAMESEASDEEDEKQTVLNQTKSHTKLFLLDPVWPEGQANKVGETTRDTHDRLYYTTRNNDTPAKLAKIFADSKESKSSFCKALLEANAVNLNLSKSGMRSSIKFKENTVLVLPPHTWPCVDETEDPEVDGFDQSSVNYDGEDESDNEEEDEGFFSNSESPSTCKRKTKYAIGMPLKKKSKKNTFLNGTKFKKYFRGSGGGWFDGEVVGFNGEHYHVRYNDGDEELMSGRTIAKWLEQTEQSSCP